jgi:hypothetical protein
MKASSIFKTVTLGHNWVAETFNRIDRGEATEIGNNIARISEIPAIVFIALARAIELARKGEAAGIVHKSDYQHINDDMTRKLSLLKDGALMAITLTKGGQLRGWVGGPHLYFWEDGRHVDGYGSNAIFDITGDFAQVMELAEKYLTGKMRRFEDDKYVVWI